jgi:predicted MFS family arabinose efflux permease
LLQAITAAMRAAYAPCTPRCLFFAQHNRCTSSILIRMQPSPESSVNERNESEQADLTADPSSTSVREFDNGSPWVPLRAPIFRAFWLASIVSNLGTWVHEVGAGWLMTELDSSPEMVSAVRIALSAPMMILAIPAGVIVDRLDRRRLLIMTQLVLFSTTATLATLTLAGMITSWSLLGLTFVVGLGMVLHVLAWQTTVPALVPKNQLSRAIALGSISFNLARAIGPALGGVLIALAGVWIAFAVNALSFAGILVVLLSWRSEQRELSHSISYRASMIQGFQHVLGQPTMRNVLVGLSLFSLPAGALWSLLPLVARKQLHWDADGYGLLVTTIGIGAVFAARFLHSLHRKLGFDRTIAVAMVVFALGLLMIGATSTGAIALIAAFAMGASWMLALTTLNTTAQMTLKNELRARGMGCYMTVMAFSMSLGALLWGRVAGSVGLANTQWIAAATLIVTAAISLRFPLQSQPRKTP